jgi:hypothetical protein
VELLIRPVVVVAAVVMVERVGRSLVEEVLVLMEFVVEMMTALDLTRFVMVVFGVLLYLACVVGGAELHFGYVEVIGY